MSGTDDEQNPSADPAIQGDGSGDPNQDREFLQDLPPAQVDEDAVHKAQEAESGDTADD
ncbi:MULTISPECIES: hypothetical protein [unclassified Microbacterium]|uniref:hypothetical protein n=1 Tax=unclassified Microbacterium TaxID=2609290 RepID=UPI0016034569|nr:MULTISPECIES: hypothetical protein [unclassified Microbacterium]MBT2486025.1 hypothetical protein [Microbacterium sp. ISL-108]